MRRTYLAVAYFGVLEEVMQNMNEGLFCSEAGKGSVNNFWDLFRYFQTKMGRR